MCEPNDFYLRVFTFWFDIEKALFQVIFGSLVLSISVCRLRERVCLSKSVYVHVVHDFIEICSLLCNQMTALISHWD